MASSSALLTRLTGLIAIRATSALRGLNRLPDALWRQRHVDMLDAQRRERIHHRVDNRLTGGDGAGLADALDARQVVRAGCLGARRLNRGNLGRIWHGIVRHAAGDELARLGVAGV